VRILVLPVVLWGLLWTALILVVVLTNRPPRALESGAFAVGTYLFFGLATDVFFYLWASGKLRSGFRQAATTRFQRGRTPNLTA
jgi:hypothetical protein